MRNLMTIMPREVLRRLNRAYKGLPLASIRGRGTFFVKF